MTHAVELPIPRDWQVFEDFCRDLFAAEWGDPETEKHGRPGQADHGVDVFGQRNGKWAAVQCKRRRQFPEVKLSKAEIRAEVASAQGFELPLDLLVIATTAPVDAPLQTFAAGLRKNDSDPRVIVSGWQALVERLQDHPQIFEKWRQKLSAGDPLPPHLPFRPLGDLLKGREAELATLAEGLEGAPTGAFAVTQQRLEAVHGLGGVGKTALAVEHAWLCQERYSGIFFVQAESPELLRSGLAALAPIVKLPEGRDEDGKVEAVVAWLEDHRGWLLILDNVDDEEAATAVTALLPRLSAGRVLITSRLSNWSADVAELALDVLEIGKAAQLLRARASKRVLTEDDAEQAKSLAEELGRLPLALEQAAAYIDVHRESFPRYRELLEQDSSKVMGWYDPRLMRYPRSVALTWQRSFDRLGPSARAILHLVAFLASFGIHRSLFENEAAEEVLAKSVAVFRDPETGFDLSEGVAELTSYSLLQKGPPEGFSLHRLVQGVVRSRLTQSEQEQWVEHSSDLVLAASPGDPTDARHWTDWERLLPHVIRVLSHASNAQVATPRVALLARCAGLYLCEKGVYPVAEACYRHALEVDERVYGKEGRRVAVDLNNLATLLAFTNRHEEAEGLLRRAVEIDEIIFGPEHPEVGADLSNLASVLLNTNRLQDAEPVIRRVIDIFETNHGRDHPIIATPLNNLGLLFQATNRPSEAEAVMRRAVRIDEASDVGNQPNMAIRLANLACLLETLNRPSEADPLMRRALAIDKKLLGPQHPQTINHLVMAAKLFSKDVRLEDAQLHLLKLWHGLGR